jgi:hypothetical protein
LANNKEKLSRVAAERNAANQHQDLCQFLNEEGMRDKLLSGLTDSLELTLLKKLLTSRQAVELEDFSKEEIVSPSAVSGAAKRLNNYLADFSRKVNLLAGNHVAVTIPRRVGGLQLGYYLACFDTNRKEYLDGIETTRILLRRPFLQADVGQFSYLRPIEEVLEIGVVQEPKWFRKKGPVAVDFEDNRVYRREDRLRELKTLVMNNPVSMLEGIAATGKTVLVLTLAYDLHKAGEGPVYYFDCDKKRDFDESILVRELKSTEGIFILENIHLAPQKFQSVYSAFKNSDRGAILLTSRPSFRDYQYSKDDDLAEMKRVNLEPFEEVEQLIRKFSEHDDTPEIPMKLQEQIKDVCTSSLWLVSYTLDGCVKAGGIGKPEKWLEAGVKADLNDLRNIEETFPEVLVVLSPLYRHEVLTEENYLTNKLGFNYDVLNELVKRGEITSQTRADGAIFYGLPHSGLADTYWEHGCEYRKRRRLPQYDDFVYEYAGSGTPNAMEVIASLEKSLRENVLRRLYDNGKLAGVIEREQSASSVAHCMSYSENPIFSESCIVKALVAKVSTCDDISGIGSLISSFYDLAGRLKGRRLWRMIDKAKLAQKLTLCPDVKEVASCLDTILETDAKAAHALCESFDAKDWVSWPDRVEDIDELGKCLSILCRANKEVSLKLWSSLDKNILAKKLSSPDSLWEAMHCINDICEADSKWGWEICDCLKVGELVSALVCSEDVDGIGSYVSTIWEANREVGAKIWGLVDKGILSAKINQLTGSDAGQLCLSSLHQVDPCAARELCHMLDPRKAAERVHDAEVSLVHIGHFIETVSMIDERAGRDIRALLDLERLSERIVGTEDLFHAFLFINCAYRMDEGFGRELWRCLDRRQLAYRISRYEDILAVVNRIENFASADKEAAGELCDLLDFKELQKSPGVL